MTTTHKSYQKNYINVRLRGPRGALIFYRVGLNKQDAKTGKDIHYDLKTKIDQAVFPGL